MPFDLLRQSSVAERLRAQNAKPRQAAVPSKSFAERGTAWDVNPAGYQLHPTSGIRNARELVAPLSYDEMREQEMMSMPVRLGVEFMAEQAARLVQAYEHPNEEVAEKVNALLWPAVSASLTNLARIMLYWGAALAEAHAWRVVGGYAVPGSYLCADPYLWWQVGMPTKDPLTGEVSSWRMLTGVDAQFYNDAERVDLINRREEDLTWQDVETRTPLGVRRVIHATYGSAVGNPWGEGIGVRTSASYRILAECKAAEAVAVFANALPHIMIFDNRNVQSDQSQLAADAAMLSQQMAAGGVMVVGQSTVTGPDQVLPLPPMPEKSAFSALYHRHMVECLLACKIPPTMVMEQHEGGGSKATSTVHADFHTAALAAMADHLAVVVREQMIQPWVLQNFGPSYLDGDDRVVVGPATRPDSEAMGRLALQLVTAQLANPADPEFRDWVEHQCNVALGKYDPLAGLTEHGIEQRPLTEAETADEEGAT